MIVVNVTTLKVTASVEEEVLNITPDDKTNIAKLPSQYGKSIVLPRKRTH